MRFAQWQVCISHPQAMEIMQKPEIKENMNNDEVPPKGQSQSRSLNFLSLRPYVPPPWASYLGHVHIPTHFASLAHLPTPIHKWNLPNLPNNTHLWLKRDDLSGTQLSGNKVRKLEFFVADALQQGADCIITIGGIQSNHCRATAVAAKYFHLDSYLILFTSQALVNQDPGLIGNLLVQRLVGAHIELVTKEELAKIGFVALTDCLKSKLLAEGRKPYVIPVGGLNFLGSWGYIEAVREIEQQLHTENGEIVKFDDLVVACGSGGTLDGLSLGSWLSTLKAKVHAFSIYEEDPSNYFHDLVQRSLDRFHLNINSHNIVEIYDAKGLGYPMNSPEELNFIRDVAESTGVVLDPLYSGKAAYGLMKEMGENPKKWEGRKILFIHTGGLLGLYDKADQMGSITSGKFTVNDELF